MDSDGDGLGKLNGITSRLVYLKEIDEEATWIFLIYDTPMTDMGYDNAIFIKMCAVFDIMKDFDAIMA